MAGQAPGSRRSEMTQWFFSTVPAERPGCPQVHLTPLCVPAAIRAPSTRHVLPVVAATASSAVTGSSCFVFCGLDTWAPAQTCAGTAVRPEDAVGP